MASPTGAGTLPEEGAPPVRRGAKGSTALGRAGQAPGSAGGTGVPEALASELGASQGDHRGLGSYVPENGAAEEWKFGPIFQRPLWQLWEVDWSQPARDSRRQREGGGEEGRQAEEGRGGC